ncbi:hypothetical protein GH741_05440 [Aquibacillus halophilus]|uniref:ParB/Sulfiredoxin domain-containing protein n=1 Tax=Aquibacillus halophilus TaxID=930132 RepID=A0A6A8D951_9BACI|nr:hypothetical protein [Aquibacillus halophilus]MRH42118.1 hypothetical protein [Aquibacillus halophilus]
MKFRIQYLPLSKIRPGTSIRMTEEIKKLHILMLDCMHLLVVRKNKQDNNYTILSGLSRFEYLRKNDGKKYVPCIVDEQRDLNLKSLVIHLNNKFYSNENSILHSWSIIKSFQKTDRRFDQLSMVQKMKVLFIGIRYKRTVISAMKKKIDHFEK